MEYDVTYQSGYNYIYKQRFLETTSVRHSFMDNLYSLLLFSEFAHVIRWYMYKKGITTKQEAIRFFTDTFNLADWRMHKNDNLNQIRAIVNSFK